MTQTLFQRLGSEDGIRKIANDLVDLHAKNPSIGQRFVDSDLAALKNSAAEFFITGTGGPNVYKGKDMVAAHRGMNISNDEFMAVLDDVERALNMNAIGQREKEEVIYTFFSMRNDVAQQ